ncbi:MAG: hypothetical protein SFW66_10195 [Gammaproteobacteria bacterium]|nr:hypothetical protein [Gammaproteobacteria bacterium]
MLRNRRTGEAWEVTRSGLVAQGVFKTEPKKNTPMLENNLLREFVDDFITRLPTELAGKERDQLIKNIQEMCVNNESEILKNSEAFVALIEKDVEKESQKSFLPNLGNLESTALFPLLLAATSLTPFAAATAAANTASSWVLHEGQPAGGLDLCKGILFGCVQGYLTNGTSPWSAKMPQFNRVITHVGTDDAPLDAREQLRTCMDLTKTSKTLIDALNDMSLATENIATPTLDNLSMNANGDNSVCAAQSTMWKSLQVTSQAWGIPIDKCSSYQNEFAANSQTCMSWIGRIGQWFKVTGIVLGSILGLALCVGAFIYCKRKCEERRNRSEYRSIV